MIVDDAYLAERERIRAAAAEDKWVYDDAHNHQQALIDEIRRLRALLPKVAKELPVNQDPSTFDLLREFEP